VSSGVPSGGASAGGVRSGLAGWRAGLARRPEAVLVVSSALASVGNYAYTLAVLWLLPAGDYAVFGSVASLLLLCGTISAASTPWVVAREVAQSADGSPRRAAAVTFGLVSVSVQGGVAGIATALVASHYSSGLTMAIVFGASVAIFVEAAGIGYLQGLQRFALIGVLRVLEVGVKVVAGLVLVTMGGGASAAVAGFLVGAAVVSVIALILMRPDLHQRRGRDRGRGDGLVPVDRSLWSAARGLLAIQSGVAVLAGMDIVLASLTVTRRANLATYQAAQILGRIPTFVGTALSLVLFSQLAKSAAGDATASEGALGLFATVCVPVAFCTATLPPAITAHLFPGDYGDVSRVLPLVAAGGLAVGFVNLVTTVFQALDRFRPAIVIVWVGVGAGAPIEWFAIRQWGIIGLAWAVIGVASAISVALAASWQHQWGLSSTRFLRRAAAMGALGLPLVALRRIDVAWAGYLLVIVAPVVAWGLWRFGTREPPPGNGRPVVLHLGFEDPKQPGSGGGSARTYEMNRRLSRHLDIIVVCAAFPGCRSRREGAVRYVHIGARRGGLMGRMSYFACLPLALWRYPSDLVIEDFAAPVSSMAVPWLTSRPVIGMVQWLFAVEKARQYHLPFGAIERLGLRSHRHLVTVSQELGDTLRRRNPRAEVTVVENGLDDAAFAPAPRRRQNIVYLGRLEIAQKGLDLLVRAYAQVAAEIPQRLVIAGDGPDLQALADLAAELDVAGRIDFVGRVSPAQRAGWLAGADLLVMPSRYETFGMVAAEALAARTPVIAFDIPCLRGLVSDRVGALVQPFDVGALAQAMRDLALDTGRRRALGQAGPEIVSELRWDHLAERQLAVYRRTMRPTAHREEIGLNPVAAGNE
jgi:glycosyltransferase involved in cell wall biosynthesis/O-antigen/teichoic acid export membrane protein